jgi:predicted dehydrogenase
MAERLLFGVLGTGGMSHGHGRAILDRDDATLTAIGDPREKALDAMRSRVVPTGFARPARFHDLDALTSHGVDAVVIVTLQTQYAGQVVKALASGVHVLCERP